MITRLFRRERPQHSPQGVTPRVPEGTRVYAVGDIHGRVDLLRDLHLMIHEDAYRHQAPRNVIIYLGDYVDRGEGSAAVLDLLLDEPLPSFETVHLKGNHEDSMLRFLDDVSIGPAWLFYGGAETLLSYGVKPPDASMRGDDLVRAQRELRQRLPERHRRFLEQLSLAHEEGDYFFVHAGVRPGTPLDHQSAEDLIWIRDEFLLSDEEFGRIIVHGHTISERPDVRRNRIGIDTGAFASGRLTCLMLEGEEWGFLQT